MERTKEEIYHEEIEELIEKAHDIAMEHDIQFLNITGLGEGERRTTVTTYNPLSDNDEDFNPMIKTAKQIVYYDGENEILDKYKQIIKDLVTIYAFSFDYQEDRQADVHNPEIGDLAVETTNPYSVLNSIGTITEITKDDNGNKEYTIESLDGRTVEWSNCRFLKIPDKEKTLGWI